MTSLNVSSSYLLVLTQWIMIHMLYSVGILMLTLDKVEGFGHPEYLLKEVLKF